MTFLGDPVVIASNRFVCRDSSGEDSELIVEIGAPVRVDENEATCRVAIRGPAAVPRGPKDIHGEGTLQALCLAIKFAYQMVRTIESRGYEILCPEGDEAAPLDAIFGRGTSAPGKVDP